MIYTFFPLFFFFLTSFTSVPSSENKKALRLVDKVSVSNHETNAEWVYNNLNANHLSLPQMQSFSEALKGFNILKAALLKCLLRRIHDRH